MPQNKWWHYTLIYLCRAPKCRCDSVEDELQKSQGCIVTLANPDSPSTVTVNVYYQHASQAGNVNLPSKMATVLIHQASVFSTSPSRLIAGHSRESLISARGYI